VRERALTAQAAKERYLRFLQPPLSCIAEKEWVDGPPPRSPAGALALTTRDAPVRLSRRRGLAPLLLTATQRFEIAADDRFEGEWKVRTKAYAYVVSVATRRMPEPVEVFAWHWHPVNTPQKVYPHLHVRSEHRLLRLALKNLHIPTGRASLEEVVRLLVDELRVEPARTDWRSLIEETEARFRGYRTWA
jgi:hypothetical protein